MKILVILLAGASGLFAQGTTPAIAAEAASPIRGPLIMAIIPDADTARSTQITPENVPHARACLGLSNWPEPGAEVLAACLVDGVIYITAPDNVWAVDAFSGHQIWHYAYPKNDGFHIGSRGVSMYGNWIYFMTPPTPI